MEYTTKYTYTIDNFIDTLEEFGVAVIPNVLAKDDTDLFIEIDNLEYELGWFLPK